MASSGSFPYEAIASKRYKSPHKNDLSFAKGDRIRIISLAPKDEEDEDDDEDDDEPDQWLIGETLDGTKTGTFPASHVQAVPAEEAQVKPVVAAAVPIEEDASQINSKSAASEDIVSPREAEASYVEPLIEAVPQQSKEVQQTSPEVVPVSPAAGSTQVKEGEETKKASAASPSLSQHESVPEQAAALPKVTPTPASPTKAPKPSGLAARIAAFNKPQEATAPPPLPKGKPGGWKRPTPAPGAEKPVLPASPASSQPPKPIPPAPSPATSLPVNAQDADSESVSRNNAAFSAADAQSSIKMSLKERMAALQRGDSAEAAASKPAAPLPKPVPGRIAEEKRRAALAGMGGAAAISKAEEADAPVDKESTAAEGANVGHEKVASTGEGDVADEESPIESLPTVEREDESVEENEKTEEEKESERRAAIAKRMASLGGRRMGGGPALFGAPPPIPAKKPTIENIPSIPVLTTEDGAKEESSNVGLEPASREIEKEPDQPGQTLAVPRRAAPPRKKKSSASSVKTTEGTENSPKDIDVQQNSRMSFSSDPSKESVEKADADSKAESAEFDQNELMTGVEAGTAVGIAAGAASGARILEGRSLTEDPSSVDVGSSYDDQTSEFEPGTPISEGQMDENARQLEEFIRTPREEEQDRIGGARKESLPTPGMPPIPVSSPPPPSYDPPSVIGRPPSTRPASTRPPIPRASLPGDGEPERMSSPAPTRAPPVPFAGRRESILQTSSDEVQDHRQDESITPQPTIMAKPKPRMAEPVALSDDEGGEEEEQAAEVKGASVASSALPNMSETPAPTEEMTEEEEDRQRRARISAKMARMGGQPIMGAPIAFKNPSAAIPASTPISEEYMPNAEAEEALEDSREEEDVQTLSSPPAHSLPGAANPPPPIPSSKSPPPPTKLPPVPTKSPPPPKMQSSGSGLDSRLSRMNISESSSSLNRSGSSVSRPPIPSSREASITTNIEENMISGEQETEVFATPQLPSSPPPRAPPPRAPVRQPSLVEEDSAVMPMIPSSPLEDVRHRPMVQQQIPRSASRPSQDMTASHEAAPRSSRDLDLKPSSRWWRHGRPVKLPPTLMRPDANPIVSNQDQDAQHSIRIELIFEDYSATVVEVHYVDDDANEEATQLTQHHSFPPRRPSAAELQLWSQQFGAPMAKQAISAFQAKTSVGNGTSKDFINALLTSINGNGEEILPSVGSSFGSIILAQAATTPVDVGADEIRIGDIVALHGVDFKGKKGLSSYQATFGSAQEPTFACVIESEAKKRKLRCILVAGVEGKRNRAPEEASLRLDDIKSGLIRVFRLAPKSGWLQM